MVVQVIPAQLNAPEMVADAAERAPEIAAEAAERELESVVAPVTPRVVPTVTAPLMVADAAERAPERVLLAAVTAPVMAAEAAERAPETVHVPVRVPLWRLFRVPWVTVVAPVIPVKVALMADLIHLR